MSENRSENMQIEDLSHCARIISMDLEKLSVDELKELSVDDELMTETLLALPIISGKSCERRQFCSNLDYFAKENVAKKVQLEEKKRVVLEKYDQLNDLRSKFDDDLRQQQELRSRFELPTLLDQLRVAASNAEETAEGVADHFLAGKISVDEFEKAYFQSRVLGNVRRAQEDKLSQHLLSRSARQF